MEAEYEQKLKEMKGRHESELEAAASGMAAAVEGVEGAAATAAADPGSTAAAVEEKSGGRGQKNQPAAAVDDDADAQRRKKAEKARRKREKAREKERERERRIEEEAANAGPSPRDVENSIIEKQLAPLNLAISEVEADGHCLYRAVAAQQNRSDDCGGGRSSDYLEMRKFGRSGCSARSFCGTFR